MKLKLSRVIDSLPALIKLSQVKGFKATVMYNLAKTVQSVLKECRFYEETRLARLNELCDKDKNGQPKKNKDESFKLSPENLKKFQKEMTALLNQDVEIHCSPISFSQVQELIGDLEGIFVEWLFTD